MITKPLYDAMISFANKKGEHLYKVYASLIDYMVGYFEWTGRPVESWPYNKEENQYFYRMMKTALSCASEGIEIDGWYDIFGDIFMQYLGDKDHRGQCFTPNKLCDLCAACALTDFDPDEARTPCGKFGTKITVNEPSCGSGRMALAVGTLIRKNTKENPYLVCEDIDTTCVKQTAINLAVHGFYGEVICHDTLKDPDGVRFGYIINEGLFPSDEGMPTLRYTTDPGQFVGTRFWNSKKGTPNEAKEPIQLKLFEI